MARSHQEIIVEQLAREVQDLRRIVDAESARVARVTPAARGGLIGKLDGALAHDGTATVSMWGENSSVVEADSLDNITGVRAWIMPDAKKIVSGAKVHLSWMNNRFYVTGSDTCPVAE